ncbi:GntR family transcriptional regulator [Pseudonocardia sp. MH-G8]|uniref:GntR family transcriptional regulator n=1 Tax=Pseudonocardia sp. MH-G8 TaxID=1854588 RepID=UPI000BA01438|nr:GntR family transcriptional regulator [Pseudonocardia sp. MH-G8]OZM78912.1 GntR family transcriptional regulator [Pseudonocardia sp. MH-G8]
MIIRQAAPLREQAVKAIRSHILDGTYRAGTRLKEKDLCERYEVSRTVIREALRQLESERLIRIEPNVGPVVSTVSRSEARDLYEARAALEATAAKFAAERATEEQLERLVATHDEIATGGDLALPAVIELKNRFYERLAEASGNGVIADLFDNVQARISQLRHLTLGSPGRHARSVAELGAVVDAIRRRDPEAAYAASVLHVKAAEAVALAAFDDPSHSAGRDHVENDELDVEVLVDTHAAPPPLAPVPAQADHPYDGGESVDTARK